MDNNEQIERGIGQIAVGLFRINRDQGLDAYISELQTIVSFYEQELMVASCMKQSENNPKPTSFWTAPGTVGSPLAAVRTDSQHPDYSEEKDAGQEY